MAGLKLDGAGMAKMKTLDEAMLLLQRIHGLVEKYAMAVKRNQPAGPFVQNLRRTLPTLAENLKAQFGLIADQIIGGQSLRRVAGASEGMRVRDACARAWRRSNRRSKSRSRRRKTSTRSRTRRSRGDG